MSFENEIKSLNRFSRLSPSERTLTPQPDALWKADYDFFRAEGSDKETAAYQADINRDNRAKHAERDKTKSQRPPVAAATFAPGLIDIDKMVLSEDDAQAFAAAMLKQFPGAGVSEGELIEGAKYCMRTAAQNYNAASQVCGGSIAKFLRFAFEAIAIDEWKGALAGREKRLALEGRVAVLEQQLEDREHKGVWSPGIYRRHNSVTFGGSTWTAQCDTTAKPGSSDDWRLTVKRGQDGKDADPEAIAKHMLPAVLAKIEKRNA